MLCAIKAIVSEKPPRGKDEREKAGEAGKQLLSHSQDYLSPRMVGAETLVDPQETQHALVLAACTCAPSPVRQDSVRLGLSLETTDKVRTLLLTSYHRRSERALRSKQEAGGGVGEVGGWVNYQAIHLGLPSLSLISASPNHVL